MIAGFRIKCASSEAPGTESEQSEGTAHCTRVLRDRKTCLPLADLSSCGAGSSELSGAPAGLQEGTRFSLGLRGQTGKSGAESPAGECARRNGLRAARAFGLLGIKAEITIFRQDRSEQ